MSRNARHFVPCGCDGEFASLQIMDAILRPRALAEIPPARGGKVRRLTALPDPPQTLEALLASLPLTWLMCARFSVPGPDAFEINPWTASEKQARKSAARARAHGVPVSALTRDGRIFVVRRSALPKNSVRAQERARATGRAAAAGGAA